MRNISELPKLASTYNREWESAIWTGSHFFVLAIGTDKGRLTNPETPAFAQCGVVLAALAQLVIVQSYGSQRQPSSPKHADINLYFQVYFDL